MELISWADFEKIEFRAGTIIQVDDFPEARKPAYKITVDFGAFGIKKTSAQITTHYTKEVLIGKQILGIINFPKKQIGSFQSECLITGFYKDDHSVLLAVPDQKIENGARLG